MVHHAKEGYETCHIFDILDGNVAAIRNNHGDEDVRAISMETFVMKKSLLIKLIAAARSISSMYNLSDIINAKIGDLTVRAVEHFGYFGPITSLKSYYTANKQLLNPEKAAELFTPDWPIYTRTNDSCPSHYYDEADVKNSLIANGCEIKGTVVDSIIGRGVTIGKGAVIKGCYVAAYTTIGDNVVLENQIVDKYVEISHENKIIADENDPGYIKYMDKL
jgi:glucose-1-phosphate adenylyltransferase